MKTFAQVSESPVHSRPAFDNKAGNTFFGGNQPFFSPATIQPKLTIGQPNDKYEQEADQVADKVVRSTTGPEIQTKCANCEEEESMQMKPEIQKMEKEEETMQMKGEEEEEAMQAKFEIQKMEEEEESMQMKGDDTEELREGMDIQKMEEEEEAMQMKGEEEEEAMQMKPQLQREKDNSPGEEFESKLNSSKGSGSPMSENTRSEMESAMGHNFENVRIHTGSNAVQMNRDVQARAFTHRNDIYFNQGNYSPGTNDGKRLLAHELTHVVQQTG